MVYSVDSGDGKKFMLTEEETDLPAREQHQQSHGGGGRGLFLEYAISIHGCYHTIPTREI